MDGLEQVIAALKADNIEGDLWVDGSFVTEKIEAQDVDVALRMDGLFLDTVSPDQQAVIDWFEGDLTASHHVDSYVFSVYPESDARHWIGEYSHAYWMKQWGFDRGDNMKGIAVLHLGS